MGVERTRAWLSALAIGAAAVALTSSPAVRAHQEAIRSAPNLSDSEVERFLTKARVIRTRSVSKGVTGTLRATLSDGILTHDASIQQINQEKSQHQTPAGIELNFRDTWKYNVAGYRLDRLIGLNMVPVSVKRLHQGSDAAYTWWVDDVLMDESERIKKRIEAPDPASWNEQMQLVRVFDQLIYNTDRNSGNLLITKDWRIWAIDHTRAFRQSTTLRLVDNLTRCDRQMFVRLKALDRQTLESSLGGYVGDMELKGLLARRDAIVRIFDSRPAALFDRHEPEPADR